MLGTKVLKFQSQPPSGALLGKQRFQYDFDSSLINSEEMLYNNPLQTMGEQQKPRKIAPNPYRILDAPGLQDDFYLNLVDWSA